MSKAETSGYQLGQTALIIKVPEAEPLVGDWRRRFDMAAAAGVPAHVTVLYPFLNDGMIDADVIHELRAVLAEHQTFAAQFSQCRRFLGVLYLSPEPDTGFRALTAAVARRWPEAPPYGGQFEDVVPHLTVAQGQDLGILDEIEADLSHRLPIATLVSGVQLLHFTGKEWQEQQSFRLGPRRAPQ